jgi:hypothetical protein
MKDKAEQGVRGEERKWERRRGEEEMTGMMMVFLYDCGAVRIIHQQGKGVRLRGEEEEEGFSESIHHMFAYMGRRGGGGETEAACYNKTFCCM